MPDRIVKTTLVIDEHGAVKAVHAVGREAGTTEHHLGKLDKSVKGVGKSFSGLKGLIAGGVGALGLGGLAFGLSDVISKTKEVATETEKFSSVTGFSATSSLKYTQALKARGLSGETVTKAFGFLAKNLKSAELQENAYAKAQVKAAAKSQFTTSVLGRQATALKELTGLNAYQFKALGSEETKLKTVTKAFEDLADGEKKTRLEKELFGKGGQALSTVLDKNNLSLNHQIKLVEKFYPTLKGGSKGLQELNERSSESKMAWEGFQFTLGQTVLPILNKAMKDFSDVIAEAKKGKGPLHEIEDVFKGIAHFAKGAIGVAKELFKIFGVKLPAGTLGAVLAAVGLHSVKHPVKSTKSTSSLLKKGAKYTLEHPEIAPLTLAAGSALAYGDFTYKNRHTLGENIHQALQAFGLAGAPKGNLKAKGPYSGGRSGVTRGEIAVGQGETPGEAAAVARAIEKLAATHDKAQYVLNMDGAKVAEGLLKNPRARRQLAEAMAIYAHQMTARK